MEKPRNSWKYRNVLQFGKLRMSSDPLASQIAYDLHNVPTSKENRMHAVNIRQLKSNPSVALREAKNDLVVVMNRDRPDAVLVSMEQLGVADLPHVRTAFAVSLFRSGDLSAGTAAKVAGKPLAEMLALLSSMNIPLYGGSPKEAVDEMALGEAWLKRAS
jgi:predicted HTH domain antitoxin